MELFRVEELDYDYSHTIGIFDSYDKAVAHILALEPKAVKDPIHSSWSKPRKGTGFSPGWAINKSDLNKPGEERI